LSSAAQQRFAETLTPFLDLPADALDSIGRLTLSPSSASSVLRWLREVSKAEQSSRSDPSQMSCQSKLRVDRTTWETDGCSQLLQSLGNLYDFRMLRPVRLTSRRDFISTQFTGLATNQVLTRSLALVLQLLKARFYCLVQSIVVNANVFRSVDERFFEQFEK